MDERTCTMESERQTREPALGRAITGVFAGYLIFGVSAIALFQITKHDPHAPASTAFMVASTAYGVVFAFIGGYVAQMVGARRDLRVTFALAILLAVIAAVSAVSAAGTSAWSAVSALMLMAPAVVLGGVLRARTSRR